MEIAKIKPIGKQLLIKIVRPAAEAGIILPEGVKTTSSDKLVVEAVGTDVSSGIKPGHEVMMRADAKGIHVGEGNSHAIVPESGVLAVLNWDL